jgi:MerR family mercuric resistance operon transcriptional regulator
MKIGAAAAASGCHIETIRYYERIGLLPHPARSVSGYREYLPEEVDRLRFITRGRELRSLLTLSDDPTLSCRDVDQLARHHLADVRQRLRELRRIARELERTIASCAGGKRGQCAILGALSRRSNEG